MGATVKVFGDPRHPYTQALLASVPQLHTRWGAEEAAHATNGSPQRLVEAAELVPVDDDHLVAAQ